MGYLLASNLCCTSPSCTSSATIWQLAPVAYTTPCVDASDLTPLHGKTAHTVPYVVRPPAVLYVGRHEGGCGWWVQAQRHTHAPHPRPHP